MFLVIHLKSKGSYFLVNISKILNHIFPAAYIQSGDTCMDFPGDPFCNLKIYC